MEIHYIIQHELPDNPPLSVHLESEVEVIDPIEVIDPKAQRNTPEPFFRKTSREHLREARKALTDGYKPNKNPMKTAWGRVFDAERHLHAIGPKSKEYTEARSLMKEVLIRKKAIEKVSTALTSRLMIRQREMLADELEFFYLAKGLDAHIVLTGPEKAYLKMECPPLSEAFIHKMVSDTDFLVYLARAGFRRVTLGDGEGFSWTYKFVSEEFHKEESIKEDMC